ncbi:MAG: response regulator, partial [Planctomycetota bacterium]
MKVLLVDDSIAMRKYVRSALEGGGWESLEIDEAANGVEALVKLEKSAAGYDLILSDWNMPTMDGFALLKHLQASDD